MPPHVVITGASSGIGEALASAYIAAGARLTLVARRRDRLEALASGAPERCHIVQADLSDPAQVTAWLPEAVAKLGPVDVLVNNAGVQIVASTPTVAWSDAEAMLLVDLFAPLRLTHAVLPDMIERRSGCIVDIASMAAIAPTPAMYFYNAAKGGLAAASESLRGELRRHGVHVVTVYPGPVSTDMEVAGRAAYQRSLAADLTPSGRPEVLARRILRAVQKKHARVIYPRSYAVARHFPNLTRWFLDVFTPEIRQNMVANQPQLPANAQREPTPAPDRSGPRS